MGVGSRKTNGIQRRSDRFVECSRGEIHAQTKENRPQGTAAAFGKARSQNQNIDYARNQCKIKQAKREEKRKDQAARWKLAYRNSGIGVPVISFGGSGQKREAPPSPLVCKKCNQRHW